MKTNTATILELMRACLELDIKQGIIPFIKYAERYYKQQQKSKATAKAELYEERERIWSIVKKSSTKHLVNRSSS